MEDSQFEIVLPDINGPITVGLAAAAEAGIQKKNSHRGSTPDSTDDRTLHSHYQAKRFSAFENRLEAARSAAACRMNLRLKPSIPSLATYNAVIQAFGLSPDARTVAAHYRDRPRLLKGQ